MNKPPNIHCEFKGMAVVNTKFGGSHGCSPQEDMSLNDTSLGIQHYGSNGPLVNRKVLPDQYKRPTVSDMVDFDKRKVVPTEESHYGDQGDDMLSKVLHMRPEEQPVMPKLKCDDLPIKISQPIQPPSPEISRNGLLEQEIEKINSGKHTNLELIFDHSKLSNFSNLQGGNEIGKGTTSVCYQVKEIQTGEDLVWKSLDLSKSRLMPNEIIVPSSIKHEGITQVVALLHDNGKTHIIQENAGTSLPKALKELRGMIDEEPELLEDIAEQLFAVLAVLEKYGISHCDLKPENICVSIKENGKIQLKLIDFGSAITSQDWKARVKMTTPEYLSPKLNSEFLKGMSSGIDGNLFFSEKADSWGAGMVLQFMIRGQHAVIQHFHGDNSIEERMRVMQEVANMRETPREFTNCKTSHKLTTILEKVLNCDAEERWSAKQALECLKAQQTQAVESDGGADMLTLCQLKTMGSVRQGMSTTTRPSIVSPAKFNYVQQQEAKVSNIKTVVDSMECTQDNIDDDEVQALMGGLYKKKVAEPDPAQTSAPVVQEPTGSMLNYRMKTSPMESRIGYPAAPKVMGLFDKKVCLEECYQVGKKRPHPNEREEECSNIPNFDILDKETSFDDKAKVSEQSVKPSTSLNEAVVFRQTSEVFSPPSPLTPDFSAIMDDEENNVHRRRRIIKAHRTCGRDTT